MKRIAASQRVCEEARYPERRDALDQRWAMRLEALGLALVPVPNGLQDPVAWAHALDVNGLLLTGGSDLGAMPERDQTETRLLQEAERCRWPVLGVCRGAQVINAHLGGALAAVTGHVATRHAVHRTALANGVLGHGAPPSLDVNSFHRLGIPAGALAPGCVPLYVDADGRVEALAHAALPWIGVMWHPERDASLDAFDQQLFNHLFIHP